MMNWFKFYFFNLRRYILVYLSTLEVVKVRVRGVCEHYNLPPMYHGIADAAGRARFPQLFAYSVLSHCHTFTFCSTT